MNESRPDSNHPSRRDFIRYSLATTLAVWAGSGFPPGLAGGLGRAEAAELFAVSQQGSVASNTFPQSVASGDPRPNGIVLWTRIGAGALPQNRRVGDPVRVAYEVSRDPSFATTALRGVLETSEARDLTVKTQLRGRAELRPATVYYYRFIYRGTASRTGRFKTLPAADAAVEKVRFGYISCQDYTNGYYNALYHLAREQELDLILHLGDYTYETVGSNSFQGGGPAERQFTFPDGGDEERTLRDYRFGYKKYKTDPNLRALHEKYAFITIWDDHEFANDAYQISAPDAGGNQEGDKRDPKRRENATRAWAEYSAVGVPYGASKDPLNEVVIYRTFNFGDLISLVLTDERLYRDGPPNGNATQDRYVTPGAMQDGAGEEAPDRTMLGDGTPGQNGLSRPDQLSYFLDRVKSSTRRWKLWGNEVTFMQLKVANTSAGEPGTISSLEELFPGIQSYPAGVAVGNSPEGVYITLDQWDGYGAERRRITEEVRGPALGTGVAVRNFVTLTGDIHSYIAGYIKADYDDRTCGGPDRAVGVELVCPSVTSSNLAEIATMGFGAAPVPDVGQFTAQVTANNPHIKFFNSNDHGYNVVSVTPDAIVCEMKRVVPVVPDAENRGSGIREPDPQNTRAELVRRFRVPDGQVLLIDETDPSLPGVPLPCDLPAPSTGG